MRRCENAAIAERARPEFGRSLHPTDDPSLRELARDTIDESRFLRQLGHLEAVFARDADEVSGFDRRSPERVVRNVLVRVPEMQSVGRKRGPERATGVAGSAGDVDVAEP